MISPAPFTPSDIMRDVSRTLLNLNPSDGLYAKIIRKRKSMKHVWRLRRLVRAERMCGQDDGVYGDGDHHGYEVIVFKF